MADCPTVASSGEPLSVRFPGGVTITASLPGVQAPSLNLSQQLMAQASGALAPLAPVFNIIGALTALKDFVQALVTNPFEIADAATDLFEKLGALASLVPALSVPALVLDLLDVILAYLGGVGSTLEALAAQEERIATASAIAERDNLDELRQAVDCADEQLAGVLENLQATAGPVDSLISLINLFVGLVPGLPEIPSLGDLGDDLSTAAETINDLVETLQSIREKIPL